MEPLYFGSKARPLYGVYHAAARLRPTNTSVLLCYPAGQEYMRIHRAYRWLADKLAKLGFHVLRFDYSGQGNSAGEVTANTIDRWIEDAGEAAKEIKSISGAQRMCLLGLRVGSVVAAHVAAQTKASQVILWEPRIGEPSFASEMKDQIEHSDDSLSDFIDEAGTLNLNGFSFSTKFMRSLEQQDIGSLEQVAASHLLLVSATESTTTTELEARAKAIGTDVMNLVIPGPDDWNTVDDVGGIFLPMPTLDAICSWCDELS